MDRNQVEKLLARVSANIFGQCFIIAVDEDHKLYVCCRK